MKKLWISTLTIALVLATSCKKEDPNPSPNPSPSPTPNGTALQNMFSENLDNLTQTYTINASTGGVVVGSSGTKITIYPNTLKNSSEQLVSGNVTVELIEIYDRGNMALCNKPTMGKTTIGDLALLISGGEYYLRITQNGEELDASSSVFVQVPANNPSAMNLFNGKFDADDNLWWDELGDTVMFEQDSSGMNFNFMDTTWGWTNVDRFYSDPRPKTTIKVKLPDGYDNTNAEVFLTYDGEQTALASLDTYTSDGYFSEHYGLIPIGLEMHVIAISMIDDEIYYSILANVVEDNQVITISSLNPISKTDLITLINDLP